MTERTFATPELGHFEDEELKRLAASWRAQALRGHKEAYGVAHALEVELRRQRAHRPPEPAAPPPPWWKVWAPRRPTLT